MNTLIITNLESKERFEVSAEHLDGVLTSLDVLRRNGLFLPRMAMKITKRIENK